MQTTAEEFDAHEMHWETAMARLLKQGKFVVISPFLRAPKPSAELAPIPDECCWVLAELEETDSTALAFRLDRDGNRVSEAAGYNIVVSITHRVPVDDQPNEPGEWPGCYIKLCRQRGRIRCLVRNSWQALVEALPFYDLLELKFLAPDHRIESQKLAHQATERIRFRYTAKGDLPS